MIALRLKGAGHIALEEIPVPEISGDEVLVEVKYCGICGSDIHAYRVPEVFPAGAFLGHELSGVVVKVGDGISDWKPGDRVTVQPLYRCGRCYACQHALWSCCPRAFEAVGVMADPKQPGGFAKYVRVTNPEYQLYRLPENVSFEEGALVEPLADGLHAIRISAFKPGDHAMVLGSGLIGLGVISFLRYAGAGVIIVTEVNERRAELARKCGADYVINPKLSPDIKEEVGRITGGLGVNQVFDCSGVADAFLGALDFLRPRGQIVLIGIIEQEVPVIPFRFQPGEFQLIASWCQDDEFPMVIEYLKRGAPQLREVVTSKVKLEDVIEQGFNKLLQPGHNEIKILVSPE